MLYCLHPDLPVLSLQHPQVRFVIRRRVVSFIEKTVTIFYFNISQPFFQANIVVF